MTFMSMYVQKKGEKKTLGLYFYQSKHNHSKSLPEHLNCYLFILPCWHEESFWTLKSLPLYPALLTWNRSCTQLCWKQNSKTALAWSCVWDTEAPVLWNRRGGRGTQHFTFAVSKQRRSAAASRRSEISMHPLKNDSTKKQKPVGL